MTSWVLSLAGGALIGASASLAWVSARRVTGVSGILGGMLREPSASGFRTGFVSSLLLTSLLLALTVPRLLGSVSVARPLVWIVVAGLLVGFGTQLGSGCTSGHGVCGISRGSVRSLAATATFMLAASLVVLLTRHVFAGILP